VKGVGALSVEAAHACIQRIEADGPFAVELEALRGDPHAVITRVRAAGFDTDPPELRQALLEHYDGVLTSEQLDQIAAGVDSDFIAMAAGIGGGGAAIGIGAATVWALAAVAA